VTADEYERRFAARSGVTVAELHAWGRHAEPCPGAPDCEYARCEGWIMGHPWEDAIVEDQLRGALAEYERPS